MKNYEKYKDLVISCIAKDSICDLAHAAYEDTSCAPLCAQRSCEECWEFTAEWINRECVEIDWSKVEADTPVIIKKGNNVVNRHFARYYNGMVEVYAGGQTSWSTDGGVMSWEPEDVKLGRDEDAIKYAKQ